ncbi:hypothetical protein T06_2025 [Trichinella sp. T6]|nr:hypothetical protein T06_2025 [Trichinella sp. T6]
MAVIGIMACLCSSRAPEATPGAKFQKISKFSKNCLRHSPRHSLRANKNLHITLGYPPGNL